MGMYLNPGNSGFSRIRNDVYVDKSRLIQLVNETMETPRRLVCVSRPRRFGKSFAAKMLCAYYDKTCDSASLFEDLKIASDSGAYEKHLNKYDVIYLDLASVMEEAEEMELVPFIKQELVRELSLAYPQLNPKGSFLNVLLEAVEVTGNKFIMIIDEWDVPIREAPEYEKKYLRFLRSLFKNSSATDRIFAAAYMTGILPVKKDGSQSAISDFQEFSMVSPGVFAEYVGFTEDEVKELCIKYARDFSMMKQWYDGYVLENIGSVYNPNSVMRVVHNDKFCSYWAETSAAKSLLGYISLDFDGLSKTVAELLGGGAVKVNTVGFANDLVTFRDRDDVLTLLIHLGYLAYDREKGYAWIPNEEIRIEFARSITIMSRHCAV